VFRSVVSATAFLLFASCSAFLAPVTAVAQSPGPQPAPSSQQLLRLEELEALVVPVALYPDKLLAEVLMASTYPLELVQADRWVTENKNLNADQLRTESGKQAWEESVKSLVAVPSVLTMMSTKLDWTQKLGDAVLAQQADVMDAIQRLRSKAHANNKLTSTKEQIVTVKQEQSKQVIAIVPAAPDTVYVPYYDPSVVYGGWPYADYPPYYFPQFGYFAGGVIATGIAFGAGYAAGRYWRTAGINWGGRYIGINRGAHVSHWQHNAVHRRGVGYSNALVQQRFGSNIRPSGAGRLDFRGSGGQQVLRPGGDRPRVEHHGLADRSGAGDHRLNRHAGAGNRVSSGANRPGRSASLGNTHAGRGSLHSHHRHAGGGGISRRSFASAGGARFAGAGFRGGRGGRRSDIRLKHDIALLGHLADGVGFYRFAYNGSEKVYVGVIAQELQTVMPEAVVQGRDGYLKVDYDQIGLKLQTYDQWIASGGRVPPAAGIRY
jgi:hypothetical protein